MTTTTHPGFAYDATFLFGFGAASADPLPDAAPGEIIIRYGGWSLQQLRDSRVGKRLMYQQDWYNKYPWISVELPTGICRLRVPVPESNCKTFPEQQGILSPDEQVAPVVLVASALLAHRLQTDEDLLTLDWTRSQEQTADGRVELYWYKGRLSISSDWDGARYGRVWVSSVRKC